MLQSNFPNGFANGVLIRNVPLHANPGKTFWVGNSATLQVGEKGAADFGNRGSFLAPFATLNYAISQCAANRGDVIFVRPSQAETISAAGGVTANIAGITIVGLGNGSNMPTYTFATSTAATLLVSAANVRIKGLRFRCNIASQVTMLDLQGTDCTVEECDFAEGSATGLSYIALAGAANAADRLRILNNRFYSPTAGNYNHAIGLNTVNDKVEVAGNWIYGNFALSCLHNITGQVLTNLSIHDNYIRNLTGSKNAMQMVSNCTGSAYQNVLYSGSSTAAGGVYGSLATPGENMGREGMLDAGQSFWIAKTGVVSSTVTQAGVDITATSTTGPLAIEDVVVQTNGTGLAGGTNFQITLNNASGASVFFAETVANLGANKTVDMTGASVTKIRSVLETGKKLTLKSTVADCTGAGTIDIYVKFRRQTAGANIVTV